MKLKQPTKIQQKSSHGSVQVLADGFAWRRKSKISVVLVSQDVNNVAHGVSFTVSYDIPRLTKW